MIGLHVPRVEVSVNGRRLTAAREADVLSLTVVQEPDTLDELSLVLVDAPDQLLLDRPAAPPFDIGDGITVALGYDTEATEVFDGEITGLSARLPAESPPTLEVRAHSYLHRLLRGTHTRAFRDVKDSDVARRIAADVGLGAEVVDTGTVHEHLLQYNQTDLAFLRERAHRLGYALSAAGRKLRFGPVALDGPPALALVWGDDLEEVTLTADGLRQVPAVEVHGQDPATAAPFAARTTANDVPVMGARTPGASVGQRLVAAIEVVTDPLAVTPEEAQRRARGRLRARAAEFVHGTGTTRGRAELRAGTVVTVRGVGAWLTGDYYVARVTHTVDAEGFETRFAVQRTGYR